MTRVAVAEYAVLFWRDGTLVWDDYLHHRQFALTPDSERVLRWFASWRELDSIAELGELSLGIARRLLEAQVLVAEGSAEHVEQQQMLAEWGTWGPSARYLHFAARTGSDVRFADVLDDELRSAAKASEQPAPAPAKSYPQHPMIPVPGDRPDSSGWRRPGLVDALFERRSVRQFTADPVSLDAVGTVARVATGPVEVIDHPQVGQVLLKTSPSAGARTPIELYLYANRVDGLAPGFFHYAPLRGGLERIGDSVPGSVLGAALGEQPWLSDCAALLIYTAVPARTRWRYERSRAYRDILIELGHVSQTVLLTATALGLGAVTATAMRDRELEDLLGCDPTAEPALAVTALGRPAAGLG
ncbi:nitroreductase [Rhodococcus sp. WB1]|uniref:SagB/ThcOx family dehydrogenase n=1 Tax=Rhodococcus TaxID=1827 RepID=UPI00081A9EAF|nr:MULTISPECIES: SagB/ThcOx family dehydrogenase [Rhodococcus]ANZ27349.1 nitroreductase [Rhodococcus sp. WB1]PND50916.1 nitroreductase [Rhodococcus sp. ENV425]USC15580.1 SagB/ThcOx family dehydrogenase [Rhodococcus sp. 11-3]WKW98988.1 SagB/ThcOx family dehydrogenase [Rhodococcus aetherivorans]